MRSLNLVFMGTPDLAAAVLSHVLSWPGGRVTAVYCQPDRPAGRGMELKAPPVKTLALRHGITVHQPLNVKNDEAVEALRACRPDYLLVAAYGLILPQRVLDIPRKCALNVHTSLLPRYRGAAPIQRAVMNGDTHSGVTIMQMDAGMDTGPIVLQQPVAVPPNATAGDLHDLLAQEGGKLLVQALEWLEAGKVTPVPQDNTNATHAAKLRKTDGYIDFSQTAAAVHNLVRGVTPWPGATALLERDGEAPLPLTVCAGAPLPQGSCAALPAGDTSAFAAPALAAPRSTPPLAPAPGTERCSPANSTPQSPPAPGTVCGLAESSLAVRCGDGWYGITSLRPAGKKAMNAASFFNGYLKGRSGARLVTPQEKA